MKDLKNIILDRRIRNLEIEGKQVSDKYISVFNSYLEQIAESLADYTKQVRKEVVQEIKNKKEQAQMIYEWKGKEITIEEILDQIQD